MDHHTDTDFSRQRRDQFSLQHPEEAAPAHAWKLPSDISSYFRRPSKIAKTSASGGNNPHGISRSRTTASDSTARPRTLLRAPVSSRRSVGSDSTHVAASVRPVSWHPNSFARRSPSNRWTPANLYPQPTNPVSFMANPFTTTQVNGLITPLTQASSGSSCYNETFTPLDELSTLQPDNPPYSSCWPSMMQNLPYQPYTVPSDPYHHMWATNQQAPLNYVAAPDSYIGTAPPTPDLFPQSSYGPDQRAPASASSEPGEEGSEEILVGMGLYDTPLSPHATITLGHDATPTYHTSARKGLKLEETFEPPNDDEQDDDTASNDGSDFESVHYQPCQELASDKATTQSSLQTLQASNLSLGEHSFFFDEEPDLVDAATLQQPFVHNYETAIWTDVYTGAPCTWI